MSGTRIKTRLLVIAFALMHGAAEAQIVRLSPLPPPPPPQPVLQSLRQVPVPVPSNLDDFIADRAAAIRLGKALFWDMQVGSDGLTACATCHFHAGADSRIKNQISPGLLRLDAKGNAFPDETFQGGGPNYTLTIADFPFHKLKNVDDANSAVLRDRNDVVSSAGVFYREFMGLTTDANTGISHELNQPTYDSVFHVGDKTTRRVEPRNTPSAINAVFNHRNFWDGRASDIFNGVNPFGLRDKLAHVYYANTPDSIEPRAIAIDNASLASQAVGPPLSAFEMSSAGKLFPQLGRRLLKLRPLALQKVHTMDSVLGPLSRGATPGLSVATYEAMIRQAFKPQWYQGVGTVTVDVYSGTSVGSAHADSSELLANAIDPPLYGPNAAASFTQMEANFSLYFGLSVQLYESLLVSDQTPYDRYAEGNSAALTTQQKRGLDIFLNKGRCVNCHSGAEFTNASVQNVRKGRLESMVMGDGEVGVYDSGYYNIGVRPTLEDIGIGGIDPFGFPLSESRLLSELGPELFEDVVGSQPNLNVGAEERVVANGAFKTPTLRNIELTAPYLHNGGLRTLREVVEFYNRGGDFARQNIADLDADIRPLGLSLAEKDALVAFMRALTDERVRTRKAPFDHPELKIPNGHTGTAASVKGNAFYEALDDFRILPATGSSGGTALPNFLP
jgi:cytochrome c peroxidase